MEIDVAELRRLEKLGDLRGGWFLRDYKDELFDAAPALLSRLEYLEKIAARVKHTCFDCGGYDGLAPCPDCSAEDMWIPLDGEKEELWIDAQTHE